MVILEESEVEIIKLANSVIGNTLDFDSNINGSNPFLLIKSSVNGNTEISKISIKSSILFS